MCSLLACRYPVLAAHLRRHQTGIPRVGSLASLATSSTPKGAAAASRRRSAQNQSISALAPGLLPIAGTRPHSCRRSPQNSLVCGLPERIRRQCQPSGGDPAGVAGSLRPQLRTHGVGVLRPVRPRCARPRLADARTVSWLAVSPTGNTSCNRSATLANGISEAHFVSR